MSKKEVTLELSEGISLTIPLAVFKPLAKQIDEKTKKAVARLESALNDAEFEITRYKRQQKVFATFLDALTEHCHLKDDDYFTLFDNDFASTEADRDKLKSVIGYFINAYHSNRENQEEYIRVNGYLEEY